MKKSKLYKLFKFILISFPFILLFLDVFRNGFSSFLLNGEPAPDLIYRYLSSFYDYSPDFIMDFFKWFDSTLNFKSGFTPLFYSIVCYAVFIELLELFYYVITFIIRFAKNLLNKFISD